MLAENRTNTTWRSKDYSLLAASFIPAAILTWGIHEGAHWLMGTALGYDMWITFNQVGLAQGSYTSTGHQILVSMAGPFVTWIQAVLALNYVRQSQQLWSYSFLYLTFWTRAVAMIISFLANANDEARTSLLLDLPLWVVPLLSVAFVFALTFLGSRALKVGWKGNVVAYLAASLVTAAIVFSDQMLFMG